MKSNIKSFRDLVVWQRAADLATSIYRETEKFPKSEVYGLTNQMRRSVVSVSSNIAEGFKRTSKKEKIQFYTIAYGSLSELESQVEISRNLKYLQEDTYICTLDSIIQGSKMLDSLIRSTERNFPRMYVILFFAFLYSIFNILYSSPTEAAEIGLGVTKNTFDLEILPGDFYGGDIVVFNKSNELSLPLHIELSMWNLKEDSDDYEFVAAEPALNAAKWFTFPEGQDLILDPGRSRHIVFRVDVPKEAAPGSYFVMMRFQTVLPEHYFEKEGPRFIPELGVLFFIKVPLFGLDRAGGLYGAEILAFESKDGKPVPLLSRIVSEARAAVFEDIVKTFTSKIRNTGLYHFKASGYVEIKNVLGMTVAKEDLPPRYLLPNRNRAFETPVITEQESFWKRNSYIGPYTATLVLNIPESDTPVTMREQFWVFPFKTMSAALFGLVALFLLRRRIWAASRTLMGK